MALFEDDQPVQIFEGDLGIEEDALKWLVQATIEEIPVAMNLKKPEPAPAAIPTPPKEATAPPKEKPAPKKDKPKEDVTASRKAIKDPRPKLEEPLEDDEELVNNFCQICSKFCHQDALLFFGCNSKTNFQFVL